MILAVPDGTARGLAARPEVPGERRPAAAARRAEGDADAEVLVAPVEQDRPVPGEFSHERTIEAGVARPPLPHAIVSPSAHDEAPSK